MSPQWRGPDGTPIFNFVADRIFILTNLLDFCSQQSSTPWLQASSPSFAISDEFRVRLRLLSIRRRIDYWYAHLVTTVIGHQGSFEKAQLARGRGACCKPAGPNLPSIGRGRRPCVGERLFPTPATRCCMVNYFVSFARPCIRRSAWPWGGATGVDARPR